MAGLNIQVVDPAPLFARALVLRRSVQRQPPGPISAGSGVSRLAGTVTALGDHETSEQTQRRHRVERTPVPQVREEYGLQATMVYVWQRSYYEHRSMVFNALRPARARAMCDARVAALSPAAPLRFLDNGARSPDDLAEFSFAAPM